MRVSDPMPAAHLLDVAAERLGEVGEFVHEGDAGGQHRVGRVLGQFRGTPGHDDQAFAVALIRCVELPHDLLGAGVVGAQHDPVRLLEVLHRRAFLEEFGVGHHREFDIGAALLQFLADRRFHLVAGAHRHRALVDHHGVARHVLAERARGRQHVGQVGRAVLVRRRADRDHHDVGEMSALGRRGAEIQATLVAIALHHRLQARLVDRDLTAIEPVDLRPVQVDAQDLVTDVRKAGTGDEPDITSSDDRDFHDTSFASGDRGLKGLS